jgi:hypothetical protein
MVLFFIIILYQKTASLATNKKPLNSLIELHQGVIWMGPRVSSAASGDPFGPPQKSLLVFPLRPGSSLQGIPLFTSSAGRGTPSRKGQLLSLHGYNSILPKICQELGGLKEKAGEVIAPLS